jgi:hypothetical protein
MLRSTKEILGYGLQAHDGAIGRCADFLFEDIDCAIRYLVADTRKWLPGRKVLISPIALQEPSWEGRRLPVDLNKQQVKDSPSGRIQEVAKAKEMSLRAMATHGHFGLSRFFCRECCRNCT